MGRAKVEWHEDDVVDAVMNHLLAAAEDVGRDLAQRISARTPRSAGAGHLPGGGHAADAVGWDVTKIPDGVRLRVGFFAVAFYMMFSETGTSRQAARPVVVPTVLESKQAILDGLSKG